MHAVAHLAQGIGVAAVLVGTFLLLPLGAALVIGGVVLTLVGVALEVGENRPGRPSDGREGA